MLPGIWGVVFATVAAALIPVEEVVMEMLLVGRLMAAVTLELLVDVGLK
jgi:hypothetical protein